MFVADTGNNRVVKVAPAGTETTIGSGFDDPGGVAVDAAGDVIVADTGDGQLVEITPDGTQARIALWDATYVGVDTAGDVLFDSGDPVLEIPIQDVTATSLTCGPPAPALTAQTCTATVRDTALPSRAPTGTIQFSSDGKGSFSPGRLSCTLAAGSCSVRYTPSVFGGGSQTITAVYGAAETEATSSGVTTLSLTASPSHTSLSCQKPTHKQIARLNRGDAITLSCTAQVKPPGGLHGAPKPSGSVSFGASPSGVAVSPSSCPLPASGGTPNGCATTLTISAPGNDTVTAAYGGDERYLESSALTTLTIG